MGIRGGWLAGLLKPKIVDTYKHYVLGFAFNKNKTKVVLVIKNRPDWQKGKLNGVGGKVESSDDTYHAAMIREFEEETGLKTDNAKWDKFASLIFMNDVMGGTAQVHCFRMFDDEILQCRTVETEEIKILPISTYSKSPIIKNLKILIPLALDEDFVFSEIIMK